jgi:hypothetical protein
MNLSVVVLFCSNEIDLIDRVIEPLTQISDDIAVVVLTHFWTGEPDTPAIDKLQELSLKHKNLKPLVMQWKDIPGAPQNFWPCEMRLQGFGATNPQNKWVMFVDSDEILRNPDAFKSWFARLETHKAKAFKLSNYWYFLSDRRRAKRIEDSIVLVQRSTLSMSNFRRSYTNDRDALADEFVREVKDLDGQVFFDHLSWVRSKEKLLQKVSTWGHRNDKNWTDLVHAAFQEDI